MIGRLLCAIGWHQRDVLANPMFFWMSECHRCKAPGTPTSGWE